MHELWSYSLILLSISVITKQSLTEKRCTKSDPLIMACDYKKVSDKKDDNLSKSVIGAEELFLNKTTTNDLDKHVRSVRRTPRKTTKTDKKPINSKNWPRVKPTQSSSKIKYSNHGKHTMSIKDFIKKLETKPKSGRYSGKPVKNNVTISRPSDPYAKRLLYKTASDEKARNSEYAEYPHTSPSTANAKESIHEYDTYEDNSESNSFYKSILGTTPETIINTFDTDTQAVTPQPEIHFRKKGMDKMNINFNIGDVKIAIDAPRNMSSEEQVVKFAQKLYENVLQLRDNKQSVNFTKYDRFQDFFFADESDRYMYKPDNPYAAIIHHNPDEPSHGGEHQSVTAQLAAKVRVLCWVMTEPERHASYAAHVKATWGKRCNKLIFMSTAKDIHLPAINLYVPSEKDYLWEKTKEAFSYIYKHHRHEAEWFLKADDDTYVILENLRYMLVDYNSSQPMYFGCRFKPYTKQGYMSGGAGYVLSRAALDRLNRAFQIPNMCNTLKTAAEDVELGKCLERIGVRAMDSRDPFGRGRFFPFPPREHFVPDREKNSWYFSYVYYPAREGLLCCSNTAVSFHGIKARDMYIMEYLVYHLRPHGPPLLDDEMALRKTLFTVETPEVNSDFGEKKKKILPVAEIHYNTLD